MRPPTARCGVIQTHIELIGQGDADARGEGGAARILRGIRGSDASPETIQQANQAGEQPVQKTLTQQALPLSTGGTTGSSLAASSVAASGSHIGRPCAPSVFVDIDMFPEKWISALSQWPPRSDRLCLSLLDAHRFAEPVQCDNGAFDMAVVRFAGRQPWSARLRRHQPPAQCGSGTSTTVRPQQPRTKSRR